MTNAHLYDKLTFTIRNDRMPTPVMPAAEKARRDAARSALVKLTTGRFHTKKQLFEHVSTKLVGYHFQREFLTRLKAMGLVELGPGRGKATEYRLSDRADLSEYLNDESALTRLVFPSSAIPTLDLDIFPDYAVALRERHVAGSEPDDATNDDEEEEEDEPPAGADGAVEAEGGEPGEDPMEAVREMQASMPMPSTPVEELLIKINAALLENVLALRERLDAMQPKVDEAHEILCDLRGPVPPKH